jgi:hypothetical protein
MEEEGVVRGEKALWFRSRVYYRIFTISSLKVS